MVTAAVCCLLLYSGVGVSETVASWSVAAAAACMQDSLHASSTPLLSRTECSKRVASLAGD